MNGLVYLVGAGPGAPDLLTVHAARLLGEADIVFHDALVPAEILALAPRAEKIAVGKRCGRHSTAQHFINKRLADAARRYGVVVRLKGGDPMLFGRAHEEISFLATQGIRVQVVPGITAAQAASAAIGISLTRRGVSRSVVFATPRAGEGEGRSGWARAVAAADTAVLYMASHDGVNVATELVRQGMSPQTPVVIVASASMPAQIAAAGNLADLAQLAAASRGSPAVVLIGDVFEAVQALACEARTPRTASQNA